MTEQYDPENPPEVPEGISRSTMRELPFSLVLTDPTLEDNPIIYVNHAFEKITGFHADMANGRNCRFLQGEHTEEAHRQIIRDAIREERECTLDIVNYRANGDKFLNRLLITPLRNDEGKVTHFLGIQAERPEDTGYAHKAIELNESLREIQHRVKNHLAMLLSLIRLEAKRNDTSKGALDILATRVEALSLLYHDFATSKNGLGSVPLGAYVSRVCSALNMLDGQNDVVVNIDAEALDAKIDAASQIGLLVSELLTNSLQHAFTESGNGSVEIRLWKDGECICLQVIDDGEGLPEDCNWPEEGNLGSRIVRDLAARLDANLDLESSEKGTRVKLAIPMDAII